MDFYIASSNIQKCNEFRKMAPGINIKTADGFFAVENGNSYEQNALIKVNALKDFLNKNNIDTSTCVLFSDDSGLEVEAMPNELGLHTARFMDGCSQAEKNKAIVERMKREKNKNAKFICTICYIVKNGPAQFAVGEESGIINDKILGLNGFGYDPVFIPNGQDKTYSELGENYKNLHSHRFIAFKKMLDSINEENNTI